MFVIDYVTSPNIPFGFNDLPKGLLGKVDNSSNPAPPAFPPSIISGGGGGRGVGGGTYQSLIWEGSAPRSNPLPFHIPFWQKGTPFIYLLLKKVPLSFQITTLGSLVLA